MRSAYGRPLNSIILTWGHPNAEKNEEPLKILCARWVIWSKVHIEDLQIRHHHRKFSDPGDLVPRICAPCHNLMVSILILTLCDGCTSHFDPHAVWQMYLTFWSSCCVTDVPHIWHQRIKCLFWRTCLWAKLLHKAQIIEPFEIAVFTAICRHCRFWCFSIM
jgi:hypothetical protein